PIPPALVAPAGQHVASEILAAHNAWIKGSKEIVQAEQELLQTTRYFNSCRQEEGQSVSSYVLKMKGYIDNLERLGHPVTLGLGLHEKTLPKSNAPALHAIRAGKVQKGNKHKKSQSQTAAKGQNHGKGKISKLMLPSLRFLLHLKGKIPQRTLSVMTSEAGGSGIFVIELNTILNRSWIYDTGCGTHICNTTHGLRASRKLKPGGLSLYRSYFYFPLYEDGFINRFVDNTIQVSRNNVVYFSVVPRDGIFEIDLSNSLTNESSIYAVSNKRAKLDLDYALLWHCRLGHISKKRIEKLQHDGLVDSSDLRAFEKCVSCMSRKMARKPYTHQVEKAKDLLVLIHTDVCGPFKIMSRQGASYFVTFTDDFSRYGYAYLLKHKHEVFETFKVFQKEVENQLGKIIKSLHFDRGGEYMSQEVLNHLKDHGIITHRTPPYTPQHNVPTKKVEKTPYEVWHGKAPKLSYLKVWGCKALVKRDTLTNPDKLEPRSIKCIFVGYPKETKGYSFYYPPENKVLVARNAKFLENSLINQEASGSLEDLEIIQQEDTHPSIDTSLNHEEDDLEIDKPQSDIIPIRRIEQYFLMTDYSLWEVILNGDSPVPTRLVEGVAQPVAPTTVEQKLARKNEDGIFEIDLSNSLTNESSVYAVSNKRAKLDLDSALLWHCRLGYISKKRIEKLQHDELLNSSNLRVFEKCFSCMSGKMARKPYTHQVERAKDLLGLIHTDVCGPFKIMSRQGATYFVTFTDNFSRYGFVYLLKHKHEVFETFKVFQKEVENQLGKTIKSLCSDRGGEYISQEFLDHLKDHGIIAHRTPPYTSRHNGVSERRNRTLLDMV
nr:hypothetical protein [Tanacetum cinerariifolium]